MSFAATHRKPSHPSCIWKDSVLCNMWGHFVSDEQTTAGMIVSHLTMQVCGNLTSLALIKDENESKSADYTESSFSAGAANSDACMRKSLINECFQLWGRQPIHSYLAFSFWPISAAETKWEKKDRDCGWKIKISLRSALR